ncbi:MAG: hypothetical protein IJR63_06100 [Synergistaceae bacterium]|nr:hypothetical protein [Synergistaceae bacterium]
MKRSILSITLITLLALSTSALASTDVYKLVPPEGNTAMNYAKGAYNTVGTLKVTAEEAFEPDKQVNVIVQHDGKFTHTSDNTTVAYKLVKGTAESYTVLNSGDVITFTPSSIDAGIGVTIGVVMTGGIDSNEDVSDGDYRSNIAFNAYRAEVYKLGDTYTFGTWNGEPLKWELLTVDRTNKRLLLVTQNVVGITMTFRDADAIGLSNFGSYYWQTSNPRKWLRGTFYPSAFTDEEKGKIADFVLDDVTADVAKGFNGFTDNVFLLSKTEVLTYNPKKLGVNFWLRSTEKRIDSMTGNTITYCFWVHYFEATTGFLGSMSLDTNGTTHYYNIRPALWLKYGN